MNKTGRQVGLILFILGVVLAALNGAMIIYMHKFLQKLTMAVPLFVLLGIGMFAFPGKAEGSQRESSLKIIWDEAGMLDRAVWIVTGLAGLGLGFFLGIWLEG